MAAAPLPLTSPLELVGQWYTPDNEDQTASGRLLFDPVEGLTLETIADRPMFRNDTHLPIMLGITVDGRLVTLRHVNMLKENYNSRGGVMLRATVTTAFVGMHAATESDLRFHRVEARLSHLNEWCYMSGVDLSEGLFFPKSGKIAFEPPPQLTLARPTGAVVAVTFDFDGRKVPDRSDRPYEITLEQHAWLMIRPTRGRWTYDDFDELLTRIRWFFGFAAGAQDQLLELRGQATVVTRTMGPRGRSYRNRTPVWILFKPPSLFAPEHRPASHMLFNRADLRRDEVQRPLTRWLFLCRRLSMDPVFGPYFAALASEKMYSDIRFFVFAQAAEAYHARRVPSTTFQRRIRSLVMAMPRELRRGIPDSFAKEVTDTRNFGAHRDEKSRKRAATGARLYALAELVKLTFDAAILRELGFSQTAIAQLVDRNPRVDGTRRRMLEILRETTPGR